MWLTSPGAKPANPPPTAAASRLRVTWRHSTAYQPAAVAASPRVSSRSSATAGPNSRVTGTSGTVSPSRPVLASMLTPSGAFTIGVRNGFSPCVKIRAACSRAASKNAGSEVFAAGSTAPGADQSGPVTHSARARYMPSTSSSRWSMP